ncbi:YbaK/EbsC family protein [Streptomyces sp. NRRL B-24484]|uniref:YbaK/EbsC family protein n=1 Tax=Streptomyces sp. NRRL B-24484 TaxID=1463833 RepID=UPI000694550A|nr:YbaK/EbsC family protein [Streptomyces sp. NRRL B-24484]
MNATPSTDRATDTSALPERSRPVAEALAAAGVTAEIRVLPDSARTAAEAAAALGCEVGAIANSLVFVCDGAPLLVMTSGAHRVDTAFLADRLGTGPITRATAQQVREATGQAIGGVAPVGHPAPLRTVVDTALEAHPVLWAAAGHPHTVVPLTYRDLLGLTAGRPAAVTAD